MKKQISIVFEIPVGNSDELQFLKEIYEFAKEKGRKIVGTHIKLLEEDRERFK